MEALKRVHLFWDGTESAYSGNTGVAVSSGQTDYVFACINGSLPEIQALSHDLQELGLYPSKPGRKPVKNEEFVQQSSLIIHERILAQKLALIGCQVHRTPFTEQVHTNQNLYLAQDCPTEKGVLGFRARALAQSNWILIKRIEQQNPPIHPVICLDNEPKPIWEPTAYHLFNQTTNFTLKIQSKGILTLNPQTTETKFTHQPEEGEKYGHKIADYLTSLLKEGYTTDSPSTNLLFSHTGKFDSTFIEYTYPNTETKIVFNTAINPFGWKSKAVPPTRVCTTPPL